MGRNCVNSQPVCIQHNLLHKNRHTPSWAELQTNGPLYKGTSVFSNCERITIYWDVHLGAWRESYPPSSLSETAERDSKSEAHVTEPWCRPISSTASGHTSATAALLKTKVCVQSTLSGLISSNAGEEAPQPEFRKKASRVSSPVQALLQSALCSELLAAQSP